MFRVIGKLLFILLVSGCTTNNLKPAVYSKGEIAGIDSISISFVRPISNLSITHSSGPGDPASLMQSLGKWADDKADKAIAEALPLFDVERNRFRVELDIKNALCGALGERCSTMEAEAVLYITPVFVGYRFDQLSNLKYLPTLILDVELMAEGAAIFKHSIGAGNLYRVDGIQKIGMRAELGYKKPKEIVNDQVEALNRMDIVIQQLAAVIASYFSDQEIKH